MKAMRSTSKHTAIDLSVVMQSTLSHLSAHVVNLFLRENQKSIPNYFKGKKLFKKRNPSDFTFYFDKLNNKKFPHMVQC